MERQNIAQLLTVSFIALCTGYLLGVYATSQPEAQTYTYGSELIEDVVYTTQASRQPVRDRAQKLITYTETAREHGSAPFI